MSFVLDNSVTMRWFFGDGSARSAKYAEQVLDLLGSQDALVPATWGLEVSSVLARAEAKGPTTEARSTEFLELLASANIDVDEQTFARALGDTLHLARRHKLSSYDASYLELAMRKGIPLATLDDELQAAASKAGVRRFGET
jgi:predicted nucleic acid-binding protein